MKRAAVSPINWDHIVIRAARRRRVMSHAARSVVECLEDRTLFAYNLTLSFGGTSNVTSSTSASTTTFTAANTGANLSWGDIANQLNVNHNVVVNTGAAGAEAGNITDQLAGGISINNAAGTSLTFQSGSGINLVGNVSLGTVNFVGANSSITVTAAGSIKAQTLEQGSGQLASATLTAATGTIVATVKAVNLSLSAATGIGSSGTPISTQVNNLVAKTGTGGIFISNTGNLAIGFAGEALAGVKVTGASGDIVLTNAGTITLSRLDDIVKGPGNVNINANGAAADLLIGTGNGLISAGGSGSIVSSGTASTVAVEAGRDVLVGNPTLGNVESAGSIALTAGRNINVDADSFVEAHGAGTLTATAGGNLSLLQTLGVGAHLSSQGGAISLTTGAGGTFTANSGGSVLTTQAGGNGPITISADDVVISSDTISAGSGVVTLQQAATSARSIDLGGGTTAGDLGLSDAELAHVTAGVLRIGRTDNAGNIVITSPVTTHPGYGALALLTGGAIQDNSAAAVAATNLAVQSALGIGSVTTPLITQASNLVARTGTGGISIANTGNLAIGYTGEPFAGVQVTGVSGDMHLTSAGSITVSRFNDVVQTPGNIVIDAIGATSDVLLSSNNGVATPPSIGSVISSGNASTVSVVAGRDVLLGNAAGMQVGNVESAGSIVLTAGRNINVDADSFVDAHGTGALTATAGGNISLLQNAFQGAHLTSQGGAISLTTGAGGTFTANSGTGGSVQTGGNGPITISADDVVISTDTISAGTGTVTLQPTSPNRIIDLGTNSAGNLGLTDAELANVTGSELIIGNTADTGNIQVTAPLMAHPGYAILSLRTGGAVVDNNATEPDVRVTNLALRAGGGISLDTAVSNLAISNAAGAASIRNTGALTVAAIDGLTSSSNAGTTTTLSAASPITFAVNTSSAGTLSAITTETASETGTPLPPPDDDITVNPGVTVRSTGGGVVFNAGDSIVINNTAQVLATTGNITLQSGAGDNDNDAAMTLNGTVAAGATAGTVAVNAAGAITQGAGGQITASNLSLLAATGIGSSGTPISTQASNLVAKTGTGGIFITNTGNLAIGFVGEPVAGVQVTGASGDIHLTNAGSITISRFNDVVQTSGNIVVNAMGAASDVSLATNNGVATPPSIGSVISSGSASTVSVVAGRDVLLGNAAGTQVGNVESAGSIVLTAGRNINVDADSFVDAHGVGTLTATAGGNISLLQNAFQGAHLSSQGGAISLTTGAGGTFTANSGTGGSVQTAANGPITISADNMVISSDTISAGSGVVTLQQASTSSRNIDLGGGTTAGDLGLSDAELGHVTAGVLRIGRTDNPGNISVTSQVTAHAGYATLSLQTGGAIIDNNATEPDVHVTNLTLRAANGISLDTAASNLAFSNAAGTISIRNTGALTIAAVDSLSASSNTGTTTNLSAASPITFAVNTTSAGTLSATTTETASETGTPLPPPDDDVTVNPGVAVQSTGGDVVFKAADSLVINSTAQVLAPTGNIDLQSGTGDNDNDATMMLNGTVAANAATGTVALNLNVSGGSATEAATGTISGAGLLLLNFPASGGQFALDTSTTNSVGTLAATTQAAISYRNAAVLTVGTVTSPNEGVTTFGIFTTNHDVTLSATSGDITLSQAINAGSGASGATVRLAVPGAITQTTAGQITATNLGARAGGNISLLTATPANSVTGTVALSTTTGAVGFQDSAAFTVGTVSAAGPFASATGVTSSGDVTLCSGGALTITAPINAGAATARLQSAGNITQTAAGTITASNLGVVSAGSVGLSVTAAPNNISGNFAANASGGPSGSFVHLLNAGPVTIGTVTASTCFAGAGGLQTNNGNADLQVQGPGTLTLTQPVNAAGASVLLDSGGGIVQTASGPITAMNLAVIGAGNIDLSAVVNGVLATFAAQNSGAGGSVRFNNGLAFTIGSITSDVLPSATVGITTSNGDVDLATTGALTLAAPINAGGGVIRLAAAAAVSQTASSPLTAAGLSVAAAGNVTLNQPANSIGMFAASLSGGGSALYLATSGAFTVGAVGGDAIVAPHSGISAAGNVTLVPASGVLTISQDISAAMLTLWPQAGGVHQTAGTITATALVQPAGSVPSIYAGSIFTAAGGMQLTGSDFSLTGPINLNSGPLTLSDTGVATISGAVSGSGGLVMNGPGTLTLSGANTYAAPTTVTAGTLIIAAAGALPALQNVVNNGALRINANAGPGPITGAGSLSVSAAVLTTPSFSQGPVTIQGMGVIKLQGASPAVSNASLLSIDAASKLDLTTNMLRVNYSGGSDPIAAIRSYLTSGYAGGTWTGAGITTSAGDATHALGFGDSDDGIVQGLPANTLLIRWTRYGDVNLDGAVGFADLLTVARNYGKSGRNWDQGDMNYDGAVDFGDLVTVARNYGATAAVQPVTAMVVAAPVETSVKKRRRR